MKLLYSLLLICASAPSLLCEEAWTKRLAPQDATESVDQLEKTRELVAAQTAQIKGILDTVCDALRKSDLPSKDSLCRELSLLRDFIQHLTTAIPTMQEQDLAQLVRVNTLVLDELMNQLQHGDLQGMCSVNISKIKDTPREWISAEQLQTALAQLHDKIVAAWNAVTAISLADYSEPASSYAQQIWTAAQNNQGALIVATAAAIGTAWAIRSYTNGTDLKDIIKRVLTYDLLALYLLRQKKDKDIAELSAAWFGKDSTLANAMLTAKQYVGSPKEKKTAVHVIANKEMSAQEQVDWAEAQNCAVLKTEKGRDCDFLKNFFEFDDGLFKISLGLLFAEQLKSDINALSGELSEGATGAYGLFKYVIETYKPKSK